MHTHSHSRTYIQKGAERGENDARGVERERGDWPIEEGPQLSGLFGIYRWTRFYLYAHSPPRRHRIGGCVLPRVYVPSYMYVRTISDTPRHTICGGASALSHYCVRALATRASSAPRRRRFARKLILRETQPGGVPAEPAVQPSERSRARRIAHIRDISFAYSQRSPCKRTESTTRRILCKRNVAASVVALVPLYVTRPHSLPLLFLLLKSRADIGKREEEK